MAHIAYATSTSTSTAISSASIRKTDQARLVAPIVQFERLMLLQDIANDSGYIVLNKPTNDDIRDIIESAGNKIGSVHFIKRSDGSLRKMSYRLHVTNPSIAKKPSGRDRNRTATNQTNNQMTVFDVNKAVRKDGKVVGRGAWRTIPLETVTRIVAGGKKYCILPRG